MIGAGTVKDGIANALPTSTTLTVDGTGIFDLHGYAQAVAGLADGSVSTGTVTDGGAAATFTVNSASANAFSGLIGGALSLTKTGAGTLTLSQANTFTGSTTISAGTLMEGVDNALPISTTLTVSGTGRFDLNGSHRPSVAWPTAGSRPVSLPTASSRPPSSMRSPTRPGP